VADSVPDEQAEIKSSLHSRAAGIYRRKRSKCIFLSLK